MSAESRLPVATLGVDLRFGDPPASRGARRRLSCSGLLRRPALAILLAAVTLIVAPQAAAQTPKRIISAAPSITEMIYALGLGHRVVGVTDFCHYPPEVRQKPKIGSYMRPDLETILAMRPDLAVVLREHGELVTQLQRLRVPVLALRHNTLEEIMESILELGQRTGVSDRARRQVAEMRTSLDQVRLMVAALPRRKVMFIIGRTPGTIQDLMVVGHSSFLNELITIAGGQNIFQDATAFYPRVPREEIYARRPDVIIDMGDMADTDHITEQHKREVRALWNSLPDIPAVKAGRIYPVADDRFVVPGPRVVETARLLLEMIHPEAAR
jgi:ABC-type Fe3+-hydroxamate transport system substrate-binding protein